MSSSPVVAQTIPRQIGNWNLAAIGARNFVYGDDMIQFAVNRGGEKVRIELTPADDYTVIHGRMRGCEWKELGRMDGIFCDMLGETVYSMTQR